VALWALGFVRASVRARTGGCGSGSSLTLDEALSNGDIYEVKVATVRVESRYPHLVEDNVMQAQEREERIEKEVKQREMRCATQKSFRKLGYQIQGHVKPNSTKKSSLNRLDVQTEDGHWQKIVGKTQVEEHLIEKNVKQFSHAGATPLGYTELGRELGHTGDTPMTEAILDSTFVHESLTDEALAAILQELRKHPNVQEIIQPIITEADFKSALKCVPEKTASSLSGCGVHHYKACAEGSEDGLTDIQLAIHAAMMTVLLATGFCPERWKKEIDVMLEKIPGVVRSNKLRIIQLLEADLNQVLRIAFAKNIAKLAQKNKGIISDHQYGRAHATCMTPVLNKRLTVQLLIQKRTEGIVFYNDAKGCYDRIISGVVLVSLRRRGYSEEFVKSLGLLWAQMEHHVCTCFGVSDKTYGSTTKKLLYGIGQGSCASPIMSALIQQLLLAALGATFTCIRLVVIDGEEEQIMPGDSFVDDTTTGTTNDYSELKPVSHVISDLTSSEETLIAKMEEIIQFFLDLLQVTGGDLAPDKCVWYLISHRWKDGKPKLLQNHSSHRGIKIVSRSTNTESGVKRKAPTKGHRTLGFFMTVDRTCTAHKKVMKEKASLYATAITRSSVWKGESGLAYNSFYLPSIGYGTPATTLSQQEYYDIKWGLAEKLIGVLFLAQFSLGDLVCNI
jgi:hypothetical protein